MLKKVVFFIYTHEFFLGLTGFVSSFLFYIFFPGPITLLRAIPGVISWFCVFLLGDWASRRIGEGSIFPHRKNQLHKFKRLLLASLIMNLISDVTGSWLLKLWYYPLISDPILYIFVLAPLGYILFGLVLYVFYRLFKQHWDYLMKSGRMSKLQKNIFLVVMRLQLLVGVIGLIVSFGYYREFISQNQIIWHAFDSSVDAYVNIRVFFLLWMSIFFLLEYTCFFLGRETFTRDIIRGNFLPFFSILFASAICIIAVEFFNAPFQVWTFTNWPYQTLQFLHIPLMAYVLWPTQYFLLLPIIRLLDGKNTENVW